MWFSDHSYRPPRAAKRLHQIFPAQQHALRFENTLIPTPSCSGLPIPLARLELCGHFARRQGRRAQRPTLAIILHRYILHPVDHRSTDCGVRAYWLMNLCQSMHNSYFHAMRAQNHMCIFGHYSSEYRCKID